MPSVFWSIVLEIGFFGWVGSALLFIFQAIDENERLVKRKAILWGTLLIVSYGLWVVGLVNA